MKKIEKFSYITNGKKFMFGNDICMCYGTNCNLKNECYRYLAKPDEYQSYFAEPPIKDGKCERFWKIKNTTT